MQSLITEKAATLVLSAATDGIGGASRQDAAPTCGFAQRDQLSPGSVRLCTHKQ